MKKTALGIVALLGLALAGFGGYRYAMHRTMGADAAAPSSSGSNAGKDILYWYDPMYPQSKFDKPGKSPFMDMQLVPKYAGETSDVGTVSVSPRVAQNLGVRTAEVKSGSLEQRFEAVGSVAFNERNVVQLQARAAGFVEKLHARAPLDPVAKGAPLVQILYPDWAGAQEEFLLLRKSSSKEMNSLADAARKRLLLLGMSESEIAAVERDGKPRPRITLASPVSGVIAELGVREGMTVTAGMTLFRIVDLSSVWVNAEIPETQAALVKPGSRVTARVAAYPDEKFEGKVGAILPEVNAATRTLRTRIELANPGARLKPGMFASVIFENRKNEASLLVPSEAVIRTGQRDVVLLAAGDGRFRAAPVEVGMESGGQSEIRKGLNPGDKVVLSGQFLIDSEASLGAAVARLEGGSGAEKSEPGSHKGRGKVVAVDQASGRIELDHEPIPSIQWPRMTMGFGVHDKSQLGAIKKGDAVDFELAPKPDKDGNYLIQKIAPGGK